MGHDDLVEPLEYRPTFVRVLSVVTWVLLVLTELAIARESTADALRWLPVLGFLGACVYVLFWRPAIRVDDSGVTVVNLVRDVHIPWRRLEAIDTRFSLTLQWADRTVAAWAAPAPGRAQALRQSRQDTAALAAMGTALDHGLRSSATPNSDSGGAALMVRVRWEQALGRPAAGDDGPVVTRVAWIPVLLLVATGAAAAVAVLA
jgi:hypothetical protein